MTTAQRNAIAAPAAGLVVYNTTSNCLEFYNGTTWQNLCTVACTANHSRALTSSSGLASPGGSANTTLNITATSGTPTTTISVTGLPTGVTATIGTNPVSGTGSSLITFNVGGAVPNGTYNITITTTDNCGNTGSLTYTLTVTNCTLSAAPATANIVIGRYEGGNRTINIPAGVATFRLCLMSYEPTNWTLTGAVGRITQLEIYGFDAGSTITGNGGIPTNICTPCAGGCACSAGCSPYTYSGSMGDCAAHTGYAACRWGITAAQVSHVTSGLGCGYPAWSCVTVNY
jgi:hypothetical protein